MGRGAHPGRGAPRPAAHNIDWALRIVRSGSVIARRPCITRELSMSTRSPFCQAISSVTAAVARSHSATYSCGIGAPSAKVIVGGS